MKLKTRRRRRQTTHLTTLLCSLVLIFTMANPHIARAQPVPDESRTPFASLGLEAANWITSFQVTPLNDSWGIPYQDNRAWGLDPFFFDNGTITGGDGGIVAGAKQKLAYLIGGHDAGEGAYAALNAYLETGDPRYLDIFNVYYGYFEHAQIPGPRTATPTQTTVTVGENKTTINLSGAWAEQATVTAGNNGTFGSPADTTSLQAVFPAAEHGNPIAITLIAYYRISHDPATLSMLNRYGSWLVRIQIHTGQYAGAFPVTQYYYALGWKPRMYETTESSWVLSELYLITGNQTYLNAAEAAGNYMLSRQFVGPQWRITPVYGALPYESNQTHYTSSVSTNHAGFTIEAWSQLYRITGDMRYLQAATIYANWLLSFQVTTPDVPWGSHTFANDSMAVGGYYYGYNTELHQFGSRVAEALWSAGDAIPALLKLSQITGDQSYRESALLAAAWLTRMRYPDQTQTPLQALAVTKYPVSSWWGLFPQYYQPNMTEIQKAGIVSFVERGIKNESSILDRYPSWFEKTFSVDFNLIDFEMASRGPTYMKMTWSWWPDLGFEPRYGGDIAVGAFSLDSYLTFNATLNDAVNTISQINQLTGNNTSWLQANGNTPYIEATTLVAAASHDFNLGWYTVAKAEAEKATAYAEAALNYVTSVTPLRQTNQTLLGIIIVTMALLILTNLYWSRRLARKSKARAKTRTKSAKQR